ncbi:hypothetical protein Pcinc_028242 [Petrolisthes cinctipes]|uniref:receptor protein-tyrosine kinase n=1 Tax=Petrolisthes cinctipes TaxID=88211 RepID=A0AAE1F2S1_PETCI|nr:hypothetical protein Pcinc_028242 [Petrolisthes cinctipes]
MPPTSPRWVALCLFLIALAGGVAGINSPPVLGGNKDWYVTEDEGVGSVVARLQAIDNEGDHVTLTLSPDHRKFIYNYLTIDANNRVLVAQPLTGLAGDGIKAYIVRVQLNDTINTSVTEVYLQVGKPGQRPPHRGSFLGNRPSPNYKGHLSLPREFVGRPGSSPQPPIMIPESKPPPLLEVKRVWQVWGDAEVGTEVARVKVTDLTGDGYNLTLKDSEKLLKVHQDGQVTVAAPLTHQVGRQYLVEVLASSPQGYSSEPVVVKILSPPLYVSTTPNHPFPPILPPVGGNNNNNNRQDLRVVDGSGVGVGVSTTVPPTTPPTRDLSLTVVPIVVVAGVSPLLVLFYCCWRRYRSRQPQSKKWVVYRDKGEEAAATEIRNSESGEGEAEDGEGGRERRRGSSIINLSALWRRAYSNKYEDGDGGGGGGGVRRGISSRSRRVNEMAGEGGDTTADHWEFPRHRLKVMGILGEGCFGQVWRCEATGLGGERSMVVAAKTVKESAGDRERRDLLQELKVLKSLPKNPNVVALLGCCTEKDPIFVILEYMSGGKLQSYLRASRADTEYHNLHGASSSVTPRDLTLFAFQIARGMEFLASHGIIHRDLAARNVLVGEEKICKVADFGFARDVANNHVYERKSDGRLPIRWMAPESLFDNIFTTKSDVWSFGVLLWEIVTLGSTPYPGLGATEVMRKVREGYRLEKPDHCRREVYNIMYYCWDKDQKERPSFIELVTTLEGLLLSEVEYIQLDKFPDHTYYNFITEQSDELL